jgi:ABC-type multidrug transport system fused ATPase/permease subunit
MRTEAAGSSAPEAPLAEWLRVFAPPYRRTLSILILLNVLSAVGTFIELQMLRALTVVLSGPSAPATASCSLAQWVGSGFSLEPEICGSRLPLFLLIAYTLSILVQSSFDLAAYTVNSGLAQRARHDLERELLGNLLKQDDAFYIRRSPAEIVSRLSGDLQRIGARRQNFTEGSATALSIVATVLVLVTQSWLAAAIGLVISVIGVLSAEPRMRRLRALDRESVMADERVKAAFEDTLQGAAEIQVSGLLARMLKRFDILQTKRDGVALQNAGLNNRNMVAQKLTFTLGFIAILVIFIVSNVFSRAGAAGGGATAGLIVVLIATLPELYFKFAEMTQRMTQFRIGDESVNRLLQYEAPPSMPSPARPPPSTDGAITLRQVRYQFSGNDNLQGGPNGIDCVIPARGMTGVVGPAGSGKSTLIRLILGRQKALSGDIGLPAEDGRPLFAYLPQRPILFDAPIRENLFLGGAAPEAKTLFAAEGALGRLGLIDLIRLKGLDARPGTAVNAGLNVAAMRGQFRAAAESALNSSLKPLGPGVRAPSRMAIETQLVCAVDQAAFSSRLSLLDSRKLVMPLTALPYGREMALIGLATMRATAPLLARAGNPDEYNGIATFKLDPSIFTLRRMALEMAGDGSDDLPPGPPSPLLVAIALSVRSEELQGAVLPAAAPEAVAHLQRLVEGFSRPLEPDRINPLLPWRENLLFAVADATNARQLSQLDRVLMEKLKTTPLDADVIEAGLDYPVGRLGGRLSGGQQQLIGLGRALLTPARFLVLDEPSSAFHPQLRQEAVRVLAQASKSRSLIVVTHDFGLARACDEIIFIRDGAIAGQGAWDDLAKRTEGFAAWIAEGEAAA